MSAPVSLTEAKLFLRVEHEAEDALIQTLIDACAASGPATSRPRSFHRFLETMK